MSDLSKLGEISIALAICVVILLIVKALVPVMMRSKDHAPTNGTASRIVTLEKEVDSLRKRMHDLSNQINVLIAREELWRIANSSRSGGKGP